MSTSRASSTRRGWLARNTSRTERAAIAERQLGHFRKVHPDYAAGVAAALGVAVAAADGGRARLAG